MPVVQVRMADGFVRKQSYCFGSGSVRSGHTLLSVQAPCIGVCSSVRRAHVGRRCVSSVVGARAIHRHEGIARNGVCRFRCAEVIGTQRLLQHARMPCLACIGRV